MAMRLLAAAILLAALAVPGTSAAGPGDRPRLGLHDHPYRVLGMTCDTIYDQYGDFLRERCYAFRFCKGSPHRVWGCTRVAPWNRELRRTG